MRITINNGIDSSSSVINNNNNVVLDAAPASMVQLEAVNKIVADGSTVTPAIMSEIASVDLNVEPSMVETSSHSTKGFFSKIPDLFKSLFKSKTSSNELNPIVDFGGSYTVLAFGKFAEETHFTNELRFNDGYQDDFDAAAVRLLRGINFFKNCYATYKDSEKNMEDYTVKSIKSMRKRPECLLDSRKIPFSLSDVLTVSRNLLDREFPELNYCYDNCNYRLETFNGDMCRFHFNRAEIDGELTELRTDSLLETLDFTSEDEYTIELDVSIGLTMMKLYNKLTNVAVCELYQRCPKTISSFFSANPKDLEFYLPNFDALIRKMKVQGGETCDYLNWDPKTRREYVKNEKKLRDTVSGLLKLYNAAYDDEFLEAKKQLKELRENYKDEHKKL